MQVARALLLTLATLLPCVQAGAEGPAHRETVASARLILPTDRYAHAVLGDALEWGGLELVVRSCADATCPEGSAERGLRITLPPSRVFEDVEARLVDADGDGSAEVLVVESDLALGASLALYGGTGRIAATPFIGQRNRWLAPLGVADLDGDGRPEIAWIDRPHLARMLRVGRYDPAAGTISEIAAAEGHTNHRIGDRTTLGGIRSCDGLAEIVTATPDWSRLLATRLEDGRLVTRILGPNRPAAVRAALACR